MDKKSKKKKLSQTKVKKIYFSKTEKENILNTYKMELKLNTEINT